MQVFGRAEFDLSQYMGKIDNNIQLYLNDPKITQSFIEFNITIEEPEKMEKTVLTIFNMKNAQNGEIEDEGEGDGPETPVNLAS